MIIVDIWGRGGEGEGREIWYVFVFLLFINTLTLKTCNIRLI